MINVQDGSDPSENVFASADDDEDEAAVEDLGCHDLGSLANDKGIEHLLESVPMPTMFSNTGPRSGLRQRGNSGSDCGLACILDEKIDAGNGLPAWQGFFELPG